MKSAHLLLLVFFVGCRCLEPVIEGLDGGEGGGAGGGTAAGGGQGGGSMGSADSGCSSALDCTGARPASSLCSYVQRDGGFSCVDHACTFECLPGRTCSTAADAGCLACTGPISSSCAETTGCGLNMAAEVEATNGCATWPGTSVPFGQLTLTPVAGACAWNVTETNGTRVLGVVYRLADGSYVGHFPDFGGTCTGMSLFTQVERWMFSCPLCQFEMRL